MSEKGSPLDTIREWLVHADTTLRSNLQEYNMADTRPLFYLLGLSLSVSFGLTATFILTYTTSSTFWIIFLIATVFLSPVAFFPIAYIFAPLYCQMYGCDFIKTIISYQIFVIILSAILSGLSLSPIYAYAGFVMYIILAAIYPLTKYIIKPSIEDMDKILNTVYQLLVVVTAILEILSSYLKLF